MTILATMSRMPPFVKMRTPVMRLPSISGSTKSVWKSVFTPASAHISSSRSFSASGSNGVQWSWPTVIQLVKAVPARQSRGWMAPPRATSRSTISPKMPRIICVSPVLS